MAIITTSTSKTISIVYSADPAVKLKGKAAEQRKQAQVERDMRGKDEADRAGIEAQPLAPCFVPVDEATVGSDATMIQIRALSWLQYQEAEALAPEAQIMRHLEHGLVSINGSTDEAARFLREPVASLVVPLYRAIVDLTWGN